jgi:NADH:ubiquinone oxidoreductase subunit C
VFLTILNILNFIFKFSIKYINFFNKLNNFSINIIVTNTWFYLYIIFLKYNSLFYNSFLIDINTFDYNKNFLVDKNIKINLNCLIYYFFLSSYNYKLNIITFSSFSDKINSISNLFNNSLWVEKELSEMFGINFLNILDSRNLLLDYSFINNPLLKIFPVIGLIEIFFNFSKNWISYNKLILKESIKLEIIYY